MHCSFDHEVCAADQSGLCVGAEYVDGEEYAFTIDGASPEVDEVNAYDGKRDRISVVTAKRPVIGDGIFERTEAILIANTGNKLIARRQIENVCRRYSLLDVEVEGVADRHQPC